MNKTYILILLMLFLPVFATAQWTQQNPQPTTNSLKSVYFIDTNTGYAVGNDGTILKTIDNGTVWTSQTSGTTNTLYSVFFTNATDEYIVGGNGTILKTQDGGNNWIPQSNVTSYNLNSVYFMFMILMVLF